MSTKAERYYMIPYNKNYHPDFPAPYLRLRISDEFRKQSLGIFEALLDTGACVSCIPEESLTQGIQHYNYGVGKIELYDFNGGKKAIDIIAIISPKIEILDENGRLVNEILYNEPLFLGVINSKGIIGRNILNNHLCTFDGPQLVLKFE